MTRNSLGWLFSLCAIASAATLAPMKLAALDLPASSRLTEHRAEKVAVQRFPVMAFGDGQPKVLTTQGRVDQKAYTLTSTSLTTLQLLSPLLTQLEADGYTSTFACADSVCGGFDFRFMLDILPEPMMHVDLGDFQYVVATHPDGQIASIITSRARSAGFIQITTVLPSLVLNAPAQTDTAQTGTAQAVNAGSSDGDNSTVAAAYSLSTHPILQRLQNNGSVALDDLEFASGSSVLGDGPFASLAAISDYLRQTPSARIVLVGHTDAVGGLSGNLALSKKRAASVRARLLQVYDVPSSQVSADGVGYLAPRANNTSDAGRDQNRRVEAILASPS